MANERICKDCKWCRHGFREMFSLEAAVCTNPEASSLAGADTSRLVGFRRPIFCEVARLEWNSCGTEGKQFEAKKP